MDDDGSALKLIGGMTARYTFEINDQTRSLRVVSGGTWTLSDAERYAQAFRTHFAIARERFGSARMLVDGRDAVTDDPAVSKILGGLATLFDRPGDRFAVVTPTSLRKQQASREGMPETVMAFISPDAAKTWLFAHD